MSRTFPASFDQCAICSKQIRQGGGHELCRACVIANGWSEARFGYFPRGRQRSTETPRIDGSK